MLLNRNTWLLVTFFIYSTQVFGQQTYAKTILDSLCSPRYDGRGYVNQGDVRSAKFIRNELEKIGVQPIKKHPFQQPYTLNVNTFPYPITVVVGKDTLTPGVDYLVDPNSGSAQGDFELIEVNNQNYRDIALQNIKLENQHKEQLIYAFDFTNIDNKKQRAQFKAFAYQVMDYFPVIWVTDQKQMYGVGRTHKNYPLITVNSDAYSKAKTVHLRVNNAYVPNYQSENIIGMIPGKKKRKYVVFSAHYDHLGRMGADTYFPGANDNASGVAMLLSLARHYIKNPPHYTIIFCFFSGEEAGLEGSKHFVNHPFFRLKRVQFVLNVDIMGGAEDGITLVNGTVHQNAFACFTEINNEKHYLKTIKKRGATANSDHHFFTASGIPAFFIYSMGTVKNYHDIYDAAENTPLNGFDQVQNLLIDFVNRLPQLKKRAS